MSRLPHLLADGRGKRMGAVAVCALTQAAAAAIAAFATRTVFSALHADQAAIPWPALIAIALAGGLVALARIAERTLGERLGQDFAMAVRETVFDHVARMPARDVARLRVGGLSLRFVGDLAAIRNWLSRGLTHLVSASIVLPCSVLVLYLLSPPLALAGAVPVLIGLAVMALVARPLGDAHRRLRARRARLAVSMTERLPHAPELRLLGRQRMERSQLRRRGKRLIGAAVHRARLSEVLRAVPEGAAGLAAAGVLLTGWKAGLAPGDLAGGLAVVGLMVQPMRDLAGVWDRRRAWLVARRKLEAMLARDRLATTPRQALTRGGNGPHAVSFQSVPLNGEARVTASAEAGEKIAIMGENGAGKSTLLHLAAGLEPCDTGRVLLGGVPVSSLGPADRRRALFLLSTRPPILSGSLRRALTMGLAHRPDDATLLAVAEAYGLGPLMTRLGGLDAHLAEGGRNLSRGEAQRLLLTRAALSGAGVLLLDEPEAGLDDHGLAMAAGLIRRSSATVLFATHHESLAATADRIWRFENRGLVEASPIVSRASRDPCLPISTHQRSDGAR